MVEYLIQSIYMVFTNINIMEWLLKHCVLVVIYVCTWLIHI